MGGTGAGYPFNCGGGDVRQESISTLLAFRGKNRIEVEGEAEAQALAIVEVEVE